MCGRYYRRSDKQKIAEAFHVATVDDFLLPPWDYNVAPRPYRAALNQLSIHKLLLFVFKTEGQIAAATPMPPLAPVHQDALHTPPNQPVAHAHQRED